MKTKVMVSTLSTITLPSKVYNKTKLWYDNTIIFRRLKEK